MNNQEVMELMHRYLDGDLDDRELERLESRLQQDPESAVLFERLKRLHHDLEQLPKVAPPSSIVDAILPKLEQAGAGEPAPDIVRPSRVARTERRARPGKRAGGAIAAAVLVLAVALPSGIHLMNRNAAGETAGDAAAFEREVALYSSAEAGAGQTFTSAGFAAEDQYGSFANETNGNGPSEAAGVPDRDRKRSPAAQSPEHGGEPMKVAAGPVAESTGTGEGLLMSVRDQSGSEADAAGRTLITAFDAGNAPDGWQVAVRPVQDGVQVVILDERGDAVYASAGYPGEAVAFRWSEDGSRLTFDLDRDGEIWRVTIDVREKTEVTAPLEP